VFKWITSKHKNKEDNPCEIQAIKDEIKSKRELIINKSDKSEIDATIVFMLEKIGAHIE
jgi:hypothetical protein